MSNPTTMNIICKATTRMSPGYDCWLVRLPDDNTITDYVVHVTYNKIGGGWQQTYTTEIKDKHVDRFTVHFSPAIKAETEVTVTVVDNSASSLLGEPIESVIGKRFRAKHAVLVANNQAIKRGDVIFINSYDALKDWFVAEWIPDLNTVIEVTIDSELLSTAFELIDTCPAHTPKSVTCQCGETLNAETDISPRTGKMVCWHCGWSAS
jgi:hypothetical protein